MTRLYKLGTCIIENQLYKLWYRILSYKMSVTEWTSFFMWWPVLYEGIWCDNIYSWLCIIDVVLNGAIIYLFTFRIYLFNTQFLFKFTLDLISLNSNMQFLIEIIQNAIFIRNYSKHDFTQSTIMSSKMLSTYQKHIKKRSKTIRH